MTYLTVRWKFMQCNFKRNGSCLLQLYINSHIVCLLFVYLSLTGGSTAREGEQCGCLLVLHCVHYFWIFLCFKSFHRSHHRQLQSTQATGQQPYTFWRLYVTSTELKRSRLSASKF